MPADERLPMPNRRRLLGWGAVAAAAIPAASVAAIPDDAELLEIGRRLDVLFPAVIENWDVQDECRLRARQMRGEPPEALRKRPLGEEVSGWGNSSAFGSGPFYEEGDIARAQRNLPSLDLRAAEGNRPAEAAAARAREVIAAHEAWERQKDAANIAAGVDAATDSAVDMENEIEEIQDRVLSLKATTPAGLHVKARLVRWFGPWEGAEEFEDKERKAFASLLADLETMEAARVG